MLDNAFPRRLWVVFGAGYRVEEFEMAGVDHAARGRVLEEYVATVLTALQGEPFTWQGRTVRVTPTPATDPRRMLFVGGGVPAAARRAARLQLPMFPMNADASVRDAYYDEAEKLGYEHPVYVEPGGPTYVYVSDDPERAWHEIGPYVLYEVQKYTSFQTPGQHSLPGVRASTLADLERSPAVPRRNAGRRARAPACTPAGGRRNVQPAGGRHAARSGVAEPRAVRREGASHSAVIAGNDSVSLRGEGWSPLPDRAYRSDPPAIGGRDGPLSPLRRDR